MSVVTLAATVATQVRRPQSAPASQSRTPWGTPDLHGTWSFATVTPLERPEGVTKEFLTAAEIAEIERKAIVAATDEARGATPEADVAGAYNDFWWDRGTRVAGRRTSLISEPPNGRLPALTPAAQTFADSKAAADIQATRRGDLPPAGPEDTDLWDRCLTRGLPIVPGPYNNNIQIIQTATHLVIHHEMIHDARIVPIVARGTRPTVSPNLRPWFGVSYGSWQGDTLVVETTNISEKQELPFAPRMSAGTMTLTERFSRTAHGTLRYEFTVNDPTIYTRPWTAVLEMPPSDGEIFEYACHEGNHSMEGILRGARQRDPAVRTSTAVR
jgi:hypothetical protein